MPSSKRARKKEPGDTDTPGPEADPEAAAKKARLAAKEELEDARGDAEAMETDGVPAETYNVLPNSLDVRCLDVAQGDCTLITTPGGHKIMIDAGIHPKSVKGRPVNKRLYDAVNAFLGEGGTLDILILTHPDLDHNNEVARSLNGHLVRNVYFGGSSGNYQLSTRKYLSRYIEPAPAEDPEESVPGEAKGAVCRPGPGGTPEVKLTLHVGEAPYDRGGADVRDVTNGLIKILTEPSCTVSILAASIPRGLRQTLTDKGDVTVGDGDQDGYNCGSIVTLVEAHGRKLLFCGDATLTTERFLLSQHSARISDVDMLRIAHHGSGETSSHKQFVETVRAGVVVVSAGGATSNYQHPRWTAMRRYLNDFATRTTPLTEDLPLVFWYGSTDDEKAVTPPTKGSLGVKELSRSNILYTAKINYPIRQTPYKHVVPDPTSTDSDSNDGEGGGTGEETP